MLALILAVMICPMVAFAGENDPRDAFPAPGGTDGVVFYYRNITGNEYHVNGTTAVRNAELNANLGIARYVHYFGLDKFTVALNALLPFGSVHTELSAAGIDEQASGTGDFTANLTAWYPLFLEKDNMFWLGGDVYVTAPTGKYNKEKLVNLGANRWNYRFEFAPICWIHNRFTLEVIGGIDIYTDNSEYTSSSFKLEQDDVYSIFGHITYDITKTFWLGASYFYHTGGETKVNGVSQHNKMEEQKIMFTAAFLTTPQTQLLLQYATDVSMDNGLSSNAIQTRFVYFF